MNLKDLQNITTNITTTRVGEEKVVDEAKKTIPNKKVRIDQLGRAFETGKRKRAIARIRLKIGKGDIKINKLSLDKYFPLERHQQVVKQPFVVIETSNKYDVICRVHGGGISGQADAIRHGISKALVTYDITTRAKLKPQGLLTRDSRVVEPKKYGRHKARRRPQFSKR